MSTTIDRTVTTTGPDTMHDATAEQLTSHLDRP